MKSSRAWIVWLSLAACAVTVFGAMTWLTKNVLAANREQAAAEQVAAEQAASEQAAAGRYRSRSLHCCPHRRWPLLWTLGWQTLAATTLRWPLLWLTLILLTMTLTLTFLMMRMLLMSILLAISMI